MFCSIYAKKKKIIFLSNPFTKYPKKIIKNKSIEFVKKKKSKKKKKKKKKNAHYFLHPSLPPNLPLLLNLPILRKMRWKLSKLRRPNNPPTTGPFNSLHNIRIQL